MCRRTGDLTRGCDVTSRASRLRILESLTSDGILGIDRIESRFGANGDRPSSPCRSLEKACVRRIGAISRWRVDDVSLHELALYRDEVDPDHHYAHGERLVARH
jgi:hypothetical protein